MPMSLSLKRFPNSASKKLMAGSHRLPKKGHIFVYVAEELRRFEIPIEYLEHGVIQLLRESEEFEDPLDIKIVGGPLAIRSCQVERFCRILRDIEEKQPRWKLRWL